MDKIIIKYFVGFMYDIDRIDTMNVMITVVNMISLVTKHKVHRKWKCIKLQKCTLRVKC